MIEISNSDYTLIKLYISYIKRKSSLVISELNNENFYQDQIIDIINRLFSSVKDINGLCRCEDISLNCYELSIIYDYVFYVLELLINENVNIIINITKNKYLEVKFMIDGKRKLKSQLKKLDNVIISEKFDEDTILNIKIGVDKK